MKNKEKFAEEIFKIACTGDRIAIDTHSNKIVPCNSITCNRCLFYKRTLSSSGDCNAVIENWCNEECTGESIDWSTVKVDTPILVRNKKNEKWQKRHFAMYKDGSVYAWEFGETSWTASDSSRTSSWKMAMIADQPTKEAELSVVKYLLGELDNLHKKYAEISQSVADGYHSYEYIDAKQKSENYKMAYLLIKQLSCSKGLNIDSIN